MIEVDFRHLFGRRRGPSRVASPVGRLRPAVSGLERVRVVTGGSDELADGLLRMSEGAYTPGEDDGLEAIVLRFTRPVFLGSAGGGFTPPADTQNVRAGRERGDQREPVAAARDRLAAVIPAVGRINARPANRRVGTAGCVRLPTWRITNRHVGGAVRKGDGSGFAFRIAENKRRVKAGLDWRQEFDSAEEAVAVVREVLSDRAGR